MMHNSETAFKVKIFGDSHSVYFKREQTLALVFDYKDLYDLLEVFVFHSASVKGLGRSVSTLNLQDKILDNLEQNDIAVLCFGQVDMDSGLWYTRFVKGDDVSEENFIEECIAAYQVMIDMVKRKTNRIVIKGINYPSLIARGKAIQVHKKVITHNIKDPVLLEKLEKLWRQKFPHVSERIELVRKFNKRLEAFCSENDLQYFDINQEISHENGILLEQFLPSLPDHHLADSILTRKIHLEALKKIIDFQ